MSARAIKRASNRASARKHASKPHEAECTGPLRCAIYARVSTATERESDFTTLDNQTKRGLAYITSQETWLHVETYVDDGRTGANMERPDLQRMLADIRAGKIDVVIVYKIDRLSRSQADFLDMLQLFTEHGVSFVSVTQQFTTATGFGRFSLGMLILFAQLERDMTIERTRDKIAGMRMEGKWSGGLPPFGYDLHEKRLVVNASEAETVRWIFDRYLQWQSARLVAVALNEEDRPLKQRGKNTPERWTKDIVLRVLRNVVYTGKIEHEGTLYPGKHDRLVDQAIFDQAATLLETHAVEGEQIGQSPLYLLQGLIRCTCGSAMTPSASGNDNGNYRYYRCCAQEKGRTDCESRPLPADAIEAFVVDRLREVSKDGQIARDLRAQMEAIADAEREPIAARIAELRAKHADMTARGDALTSELVAATSMETRRLLEPRIKAHDVEARALASELTLAEQRAIALDSAERETKWIAGQLKDFRKTWDVLTPETRGRLIRALIRSIKVSEADGRIAIVFAPLDDTRRALLTQSSESDPLVATFTGTIHRERAKAVSFAVDAPAAPPPVAERPAKIASMLALAHSIDAAIRAGTYDDLADVSRLLGMTRARLTQFMGLTLLAPDIQEQILNLRCVDGREPFREHTLRPLTATPVWAEQRALWGRLIAPRIEADAPPAPGKGAPEKPRQKRA